MNIVRLATVCEHCGSSEYVISLRKCGVHEMNTNEEAIVSIDIMDVAYIAIGVRRAIGDDIHIPAVLNMGEIEIVSSVIDHAPLLVALWLTYGERYNGPWAYRVAEQFGFQYTSEWAMTGTKPDAERLAAALVNAGLTPTN